MAEAYCPLCGVCLHRYTGVQPPVEPLPWMAEIRAVKSVRGTSSPFVTGVGYLSPNHELIAHPDETIRYSNAVKGLETSPSLYTSGEYWAFLFHDACWSLLLSRTANQGYESTQVARHLFQILFCTPWNDDDNAICGHDYGGASRFHRIPNIDNLGFSAGLPPEWSFLIADPREYLCTDIKERSLVSNTTTPMSWFNHLNSTDIFCVLPVEVIVLILNDLASTDVCSLRQSSKRVAGISSFQALPPSFWASRFEKEHEMGFALACQAPPRLEKHTDWRALYVAYKNSLQSLNEGLGIRNRRRIWHVLSNISKPLNNIMSNKPIQQNEYFNTYQQSDGYTYSPVISAEVISEDQATCVLRCGSRKLVVDHLQWPQSDCPGQIKLGVSFTWFNGTSYISGLRIWQSDYLCSAEKSQSLGLVVTSTEEVVCFDPDLLDGFEIAVTISGIIGLRFITKSISGELPYTTGDFTMKSPDVGVARLFRDHESQISAIKVCFDTFKLVSVQLIEQQSSNVRCEAVSSNVVPRLYKSQSTRDRQNILGKIWSPEIPMQVESVQSFPSKTKSQTFDLNLNMDFAGPDGCRLSSLQRIVALIGNKPGLFFGLKFVYDDGESKTFCTGLNATRFRHDPCAESSFYVDGAAGERVCAVKVGCTASLMGIGCIELYSNMGNHTFFGIDHESSSAGPVDYFYTLEPPEGTVITGFVATLGTVDRSFKTFGIQSQACEHIKQPLTHYTQFPGWQEFSIKRTSPQAALPFIGTFHTVRTMASLLNVRRIRVSSGASGPSRLPVNISGLWLEYHNTDRPSIVGQWLHDSGDAIELPLGEEFTEISVWTSSGQPAFHSGNPKLGKVIALRFDTSDGQSLRFGQEFAGSAVHLKFSANMFEKLDTICWAFNTYWDHATVTYIPQPNQAHHALHLVGCRVFPWRVPEKLFWTIKDTVGNPSSVASIHVSLIPDAVAGLSFTYTSGDTYTLGSTEGETSTLRLEKGEELIRLKTVLCIDKNINSVVLVSIYTNYKRVVTFQSETFLEEREIIPLAAPLASDPTDAETFVGVWGIVGRRERRLQHLGLINTRPNTV